MASSTKLDERLEGGDNFRAWRCRILLILREHDLDKYVKEEVPAPEEEEAKSKYNKDMVRAMRIIADSIKDHLIPRVSSLDSPKDMFDALTRMF